MTSLRTRLPILLVNLAFFVGLLSLGTGQAWSAESIAQAGPSVVSIQVDGLYRVTPGSASRYIYHEVGAPLDVPTVTEDIKRLYSSGFFSDVPLRILSMKG